MAESGRVASSVGGNTGGAGGNSGKMLAPVTPVNKATICAGTFVATYRPSKRIFDRHKEDARQPCADVVAEYVHVVGHRGEDRAQAQGHVGGESG